MITHKPRLSGYRKGNTVPKTLTTRVDLCLRALIDFLGSFRAEQVVWVGICVFSFRLVGC